MKICHAFAAPLLFASAALACGPWLPSLLLVEDHQQALRSPRINRVKELRSLPALPKLPAEITPQPYDEAEQAQRRHGETIWNKGEARDFDSALVYYGIPVERRPSLAAEYHDIRRLIEAERDPAWLLRPPNPLLREKLRRQPLPADLPSEFVDYLAGAISFHSGFLDDARADWDRLLARPAKERRYRSTWAAYMLARIAAMDAMDDAAQIDAAIRAMQRVRTLVAEGCDDGLNLAALSYYWEADVQEKLSDDAAARLYGLSLAAGSSEGLEAFSLLGSAILKDSDQTRRDRAAREPLLRQLVTESAIERLATHGYWESSPDWFKQAIFFTARWLDSVKSANAEEMDEADRLAWAAYGIGEFDMADSWVKKAPAKSPLALWLRAKLALRSGKEKEAARCFSQALKYFPTPAPEIYPAHDWWEYKGDDSLADQTRQIYADEGIAKLARGEFSRAMDSLLHSGLWLDAAYVAEHVMTCDELLSYARRNAAAPGDWSVPRDPDNPDAVSPFGNFRGDIWQALSYLLARRLAREDRLDEARKFMPAALLPRFDEYRALIQRGRNKKRSADSRSLALWQAARIHRYLGMELFGTETEPDWSCFEGDYELDGIGGSRSGTKRRLPGENSPTNVEWIPAASRKELHRIEACRAQPDKRFHYRYAAAALAWEAAQLRPPDEETARMLCIAGGWLKKRDPDAADRFYQDLVNRCGQTALGVEGEIRRWFPLVNDERFPK